MKLTRTFNTAIEALRRNVLRAALTALGIIIGIAAVIVMVELGQGSAAAISQTIASMGANNIIVMPGTAASGGVSFGAGSVLTLTVEDGDAIAQQVVGINGAAPLVRARAQVVRGHKNWVPQYIQGTTPQYLAVRDWTSLAAGSMFTERDVRNGSKVCVIGRTIQRELFEDESPIGQEIRVQNVALKVVGLLSSKGANMMGSDQDDIIIAPWTTVKYRISSSTNAANALAAPDTSTTKPDSNALYPSTKIELYPAATASNDQMLTRFANIDQIIIAATTAGQVPMVIDQITALLHERHHIRPGEPEDFSIRDMTEMTKALSSTSALMTKLLLCVACISLIVGGVGIMNIMLVSVTERTREIGLRMAIGARGRDILEQFLVEAIALCLAGGIIGVLLGRGISVLIVAILHWPIQYSLSAMLSAFLVSVSVGVIFGYYPAARAAKLDPIEALRYE